MLIAIGILIGLAAGVAVGIIVLRASGGKLNGEGRVVWSLEAGLENIKHFGGVKVEERIDDSFDEFRLFEFWHSKAAARHSAPGSWKRLTRYASRRRSPFGGPHRI